MAIIIIAIIFTVGVSGDESDATDNACKEAIIMIHLSLFTVDKLARLFDVDLHFAVQPV